MLFTIMLIVYRILSYTTEYKEKTKMYKKKLSTIAIVTILTLSILLAAIPIASAIPTISLSETSGPVGTEIIVSGAAASPFGVVEVYWDSLATKIKEGYADSDGDYSITKVKIPAGIAGFEAHDVIVKDVLSSTIASAKFTITPEIKLSTTKGLPGDSIIVTGTGFAKSAKVGIGLGDEVPVTAEVVTLTGTQPGPLTGTLAKRPVKPGTPGITITCGVTVTEGAESSTGTVSVTDDGAGVLTGSNTVVLDATTYTVDISGTIDYATGDISLTATVTGGTDPTVTIDSATAAYTHYTYDVTPGAGVTTNATGSFSAVITIPLIAVDDYDDYAVTAIDADGNSDAVTLTVNYYVTVTPPAGPTGITITISGRIPASTPYDLRIGTVIILTGTSEADTTFSQTYEIPALLAQKTHTISVYWATVNYRTAEFTVTVAPTLTKIDPASGVPGTVVTISGAGFSAGANITAYLGATKVNSTELDDRFGPTVAFGPYAGTFTNLEFTVPTLAPGVYVLTVTDEYGASTGTVYTFIVKAAPVTTIALRATSYYPGDTLSFNIVTTEDNLGTITVTIRDPSGAIWWVTTGAWTVKGTVSKVVQYQDQVTPEGNPLALPADAPLGSWNWTITYAPASNPVSTKATGLFTVSALPTMQTVLDRLDTMEATITGVITTTEGDIIAVVNTKAGTIMTDLDALGAKLQGIEDLGVIIATDVDDIQIDLAAVDLTVLDALGVEITAIAGDVATIKSNIGTVTTDVSNLDAKVTDLSGDVATVSTSLGTLQGTVTSIEGDIATIDTDVGTLQADVTDILDKPDVDMTPAWIAVVLALVAAIAAVFAVITIRQKIAG